ncbi:MAG TPA: fimbria/pilus outer membrane usher protein [Allosphingosinicella sp.]|nr:fimbria/pilus outer membrane usher protein [Allosphingosinicella sp.]
MALLRRLRTLARLALTFSLILGHGAAAAEAPGVSATATALQPALLDVIVNGQRGEAPDTFLRDLEGRLLVSAATLRAWRLRAPASGAVTYQGEAFYPAATLPGLRMSVAEAEQRVTIDADPAAFETQSGALGGGEPLAMTPPAGGAYLNYDLFVEHARGRTVGAGAFDAGIFTRHGVGTTSFVASAGGAQTKVTRLETTWTIDRPIHLSSIRIGDSISAAGPGAAPVRFAGVQFARNFAVQPGYLTMPLPVASGSAAVPSVVDVYVNNTLQGQQQVAPGPFELSNVPVPSGNGTVQIVVRDLLGREVVSEQNYYASSILLRRGLHDFSYEAGFLRQRFGIESNRYGSFFVSGTHRYGFSDRITGEVTAQASERRQMVGTTFTAVAFDLAQVSVSASASHNERGAGYRAAASFERRASHLSFGSFVEYASRDYATLGVATLVPPRLTVQGFASLGLDWGGIGVNLVHRDLRGARPDETLASTFASWRISPLMSLQIYARHSVIGQSRTDFGAHLAIALGGRSSASASFDQSRGGSAAYFSYQNDPPPGPGDGIRATARIGEAGGAEATYIHNFASASVSAQASYARGAGAVRLNAAGGLGWIDGRAFASRRLGDSFAAVRIDGYANVRVYADNQPVGKTDAEGRIIVTGLHPFEPNIIRLEQADLPIDAMLQTEELPVRPFARSGSVVRFAVQRERGVLMKVRLADGSPLPAGAEVRIDGNGAGAVAVSGGEVYLPFVAGPIRLQARWPGGACAFTALVPDDGDPQPRLDGLVCRAGGDYAAR